MSANKRKVLIVLLMTVVMLFNVTSVYAKVELNPGIQESMGDLNDSGTSSGGTNTSTSTTGSGSKHDWWGQANGFLSGFGGENTQIGTTTVGNIIHFLDPLVSLVKLIGNMVFVAVTVILGVKYIWGSVESKASVKDSLITLVVSAIVFYGWDSLSSLFMADNNLSFIEPTAKGTFAVIFSTILYICNFLAIGGIVYVGIRYMMAGAEGRSQLKAKSIPMVLGIIMVYATLSFLNFILDAFRDIV